MTGQAYYGKDRSSTVLFKPGSQADLVFDFVDSDDTSIVDLLTASSVKFSMKRSVADASAVIERDTALSPDDITVAADKITIVPTVAESNALVEGTYVAEFVLVYPSVTLISEYIPVYVQMGVV